MTFLFRSMLFVPSHNEKFIEKAITCEADAIIFDLEDAVPPVKREEARATLKKYLLSDVFTGKQIFVRVNELDTIDLQDDMSLLSLGKLKGIVAPKIRNTEDVKRFEILLSKAEQEGKLPEGKLMLLPLIETAQAVMNVAQIASSSHRIPALLFGGEDYLDSVNGKHEYPPKAFDVPRSMVVMAARMNGLLPIDTPYLDLNNEEGFYAEERSSCAMGFTGILLVNPKQIPWANACFSPSQDEIEHASRVLESVEKVRMDGGSIATLDGKMIGPPMRKRAEKVMALKKMMEERDKE
ncbi:MAG TPA: CoA ester lyase [Lachnospiraceae bacterium]|nr:CoA ester lyase [Lachnospiraceae bacterium]